MNYPPEYKPEPMQEPQRHAMLTVLRYAMIYTRNRSFEASKETVSAEDMRRTLKSTEILMDILHNAPGWLADARTFDEVMFTQALAYYDKEISFFKAGSGGYLTFYTSALEGNI